MGVKRQKNLEIDSGVANEFAKICKKNDVKQNHQIEELMKQYIARDGQILFDDLYAPRIEHMVKKATEDQFNRIAKIMHQFRVDATASLWSTPLVHNLMLQGIEEILETYINSQLLNTNRSKVSDKFHVSKNGQNLVDYSRKLAYSDHEEQKKKKKQEKESAQ